ncbi:MAG: PD-(D/E)XK nuclease family protein [Akkermansia sp.]
MNDSPAQPKREFLSWNDTACQLVAQRLLQGGHADPEHPCVVVVPTRESVRLLREQLAIQSAGSDSQRAFLSPRIMPLSQLVGTPAGQQQASAAAQLTTWLRLLQAEARHFPQLFPSCAQWNEEAYLLAAQQQVKLYHELAQESLDCQHPLWADIAERDKRWLDLKKLQELYRKHLTQQHLSDPNEDFCCTIPTGSRIILAAIPNLTRAAQQVLVQGRYEVEIWLHANPEHADAFDAWGRPNSLWLQEATAQELGMDDQHWKHNYTLCADVWKMCHLATRQAALSNLVQGSCLHAVALGACDADIEPSLEEELLHENCGVYCPRGIAFASSGWCALLRQLQILSRQLELAHIHHEDWTNYPSAPILNMLKQPLILCLLTESHQITAMMELLDLVQFESIPERLSTLLQEVGKRERLSKYASIAAELYGAIESLGRFMSDLLSGPHALLHSLKNLALQQSKPRPCALGESDFLLHRQFTSGLIDIIDDLQEHEELLQNMSSHLLLKLIEQLAQAVVAQGPRGAQDLSLLGWLELSYSPAKHVILCGLHDKIVPERWGEDIFLTAQAREGLDLPTNEDRAARDAFLLRSLIASRNKGEFMGVQFFFSLFNSKLDPLAPCSLLMRICPKDKLVELTELFFAQQENCPSTESVPYDSHGWAYPILSHELYQKEQFLEVSLKDLKIPNPLEGRAFSPSLLRGFLQCPMRFWLQHLYNLNSNSYEEDKKNLSAAELGNCMHSTLEHFITRYPSYQHFIQKHPECPAQAALNDETLRACLIAALEHSFNQVYNKHYNNNQQLPQELQRMDMKKRLHEYAKVQTELWIQGWETARDEHGKLMLEYSPNWTFRGHKTRVKIDRIDTRWLDGQQEYLVIDYKTGRGITSCFEEHLVYCGQRVMDKTQSIINPNLEPCVRPGKQYDKLYRWTNLQLPFYVAWLAEQYPDASLRCGYIHLSTELSEQKLHLWPKAEQDEFFPVAYEWMDIIMSSIEQGCCLASAEQLDWKKPSDYIFPELIGQEELAEVFLPKPIIILD